MPEKTPKTVLSANEKAAEVKATIVKKAAEAASGGDEIRVIRRIAEDEGARVLSSTHSRVTLEVIGHVRADLKVPRPIEISAKEVRRTAERLGLHHMAAAPA